MQETNCELCKSEDELSIYPVSPNTDITDFDKSVNLCAVCLDQITTNNIEDAHFRCLKDSMWSERLVVQVLSYRILKQIDQSWAFDCLDMLYLDDEAIAWANDGASAVDDSEPTLDSNGVALQAGDTVTIIKDLDVKGAGFTAKRGTSVRNIALTNNPLHIEGRVNGVKIVLVSKYLKKA